MKATKLFREFFDSEKSSGIILLACTVASLLAANFFIGEKYIALWHQDIGFSFKNIHLNLSFERWINDGLMAVFFLMVGLELKRELFIGELSTARHAFLPVIAAVGGMIVPALIHFAFNKGTSTQSGFGIPMATDIAFALGILSMAKNIPPALKVFLAALAIIDDLGAIVVIAFFYSSGLQTVYLLTVAAVFILLLILKQLKIHRLIWYIAGGIIMWYCMLQSGVHASISGVLLAFAIPFGDGKEKSPSYFLQHWLHKPVAFIILPLFALANTAIIISGSFNEILLQKNSLGIIAGLVAGKPLGILLFCFIAIKIKWGQLPQSVSWFQLAGVAVLAGIGFTMSVFITLLAFNNESIVQQSKIAVMLSSLAAGVIGFLLIKRSTAALLK